MHLYLFLTMTGLLLYCNNSMYLFKKKTHRLYSKQKKLGG